MFTGRDPHDHSTPTPSGFGRRLRTAAAAGVLAIGLAGIVSTATASAHAGSVVASETCSSWSVAVTLAHNVTPDRFVDVVTTIPGKAGIVGGHYHPSDGLIWDAAGQAPATGTVTLNIYLDSNGSKGALEFTASGSIAPPQGCVASPAIATAASPGGPVGTVIHDTATLSGGNSPTGTVTFALFAGTASCTDGNALYTSPAEPLSTTAPFTATSGLYTSTGVGTFEWRATYSGDTRNQGVSSTCGAEPVHIVQAAPAITTTASAGGVAPISVHDSATVSGGANPSGTVVFALYPDTASCTAGTGAIFTSAAVTLVAGVATSGSFDMTTAGTDQWRATYSGDANNAAVSSTCGDEPVTTTAAPGGVQGITTGSGGGVGAITTPGTGASGAVAEVGFGALLILAGFGAAVTGAFPSRRRRSV